MGKIFTALLLVAIAFQGSAQISPERQTLSCAGETAVSGNLVFCYTIGEPIATAAPSGNLFFTQGFQQPLQNLTATKDLLFDLNYTVYPNPASSLVNIDLFTTRTTELELSLYTMEGKLALTSIYKLYGKGTLSLDIGALPSAVYLLSIFDRSANAFATEVLQVAH